MRESVLKKVAELLGDHYGSWPSVGPRGEWTTLVRVVLLFGRKITKPAEWSWLGDSVLQSVAETAACGRAALESALESSGYALKSGASLPVLAQWWQRRIGNESSTVDQWAAACDRWREELRQLPGVNWELADRILLFVGGVETMPLDRGTMRIAARHGWVETTAEYGEWQSFFVRGLNDASSDVAEFSQSMTQIGRDFCGKTAKCDECPLWPLLPAGGPIPIDGSE